VVDGSGTTGSRESYFATDIRTVCGRLRYGRFEGGPASSVNVAVVQIAKSPVAPTSGCFGSNSALKSIQAEGLLAAHPCRTAEPYRMAAFGAERKHAISPTDFRSPLESSHSLPGYRMARFAPFRTLPRVSTQGR